MQRSNIHPIFQTILAPVTPVPADATANDNHDEQPQPLFWSACGVVCGRGGRTYTRGEAMMLRLRYLEDAELHAFSPASADVMAYERSTLAAAQLRDAIIALDAPPAGGLAA